MKYFIEFPKYFTNDDLGYMFHQYEEALNSSCEEIVFDLRPCKWLPPTALVTIVSMYKNIEVTTDCRIELLHPNDETKHYLNRIDFYENIEIDVPFIYRNDSTGRFREIENINSVEEVRNVSNDLVTIIENQANVSEKLVDDIESCLGEILDNIFHHSYSPIDGFVCAQTFSQKREAEFAICDTGIGIMESLLKNPENSFIADDKDAIEKAVQNGVTGTVDFNAAGFQNSGEGLYFIKEALLSNNGKFKIYSGKGMMEIERGNIFFNDFPFWPGTLISIRIKLDNDFPLYENIEREIEGAEGFDMFEF